MSVRDGQVIGIIGMGEMGRMYADTLAKDPACRLIVCDRPDQFENLREDYKYLTNVEVVPNGHLVSASADFIMYSVDAEHLGSIVREYGPCEPLVFRHYEQGSIHKRFAPFSMTATKSGSIVSGQTSVKAPEQLAFDNYLPSDVKICSLHSLHGPAMSPEGQALVIIPYRCSPEDKQFVMDILAPLRSRYVELSYAEHDHVMANTQACTHAAFLSMGTAWHAHGSFPWESGRYVGGIEVAKINITLRIYASKWHVYAGLAILNPSAKTQIDQFARSVTELFILMITNDEKGLRDRVYAGRDHVFGSPNSLKQSQRAPILVSDDVFTKFAVGEPAAGPSPPNSHLTLLAIVDCWRQLDINPFAHLDLAATPVYRLWFGLIQYLFISTERLEDAIHAAVNNIDYRGDDAEFVVAARGWSQCVSYGDFSLYRKRFEDTATFFKPRMAEGNSKGTAILKLIIESGKKQDEKKHQN